VESSGLQACFVELRFDLAGLAGRLWAVLWLHSHIASTLCLPFGWQATRARTTQRPAHNSLPHRHSHHYRSALLLSSLCLAHAVASGCSSCRCLCALGLLLFHPCLFFPHALLPACHDSVPPPSSARGPRRTTPWPPPRAHLPSALAAARPRSARPAPPLSAPSRASEPPLQRPPPHRVARKEAGAGKHR